MGRVIEQTMLDKKRRTYRINFPSELDPERVNAWIRSLSGTLRTRQAGSFFAQPAIVVEVWADNTGITHRLKMPYQYEPMVRTRLESLIPGVRLTPEEEHPVRVWVHAAEFGLKAPTRQLKIPDPADMSTNILTNFSALNEAETLVLQWVIGPAQAEHKPDGETVSTSTSMFNMFFGSNLATKDEINDRRAKLDEPNMQAVLRVAAVANTPVRAQYMVQAVLSSIDSARGPATHFYRRMVTVAEVQRRISESRTPFTFPAKLSAPELTAVIGFPLGTPSVAGLPAAVSRYLPASDRVPSTGRVLGVSTFPGRERKIAVSYEEARKHVHVLGGTGSGKTTLLANMIKQDMEAGFGVVLIESKGDLFRQALDYVPKSRINDVIIFDVGDVERPVGYNILHQSHPDKVVDELNSLFNALFRDHPSLWMQEVMYWGLKTLIEDKTAAFTDLPALLSPNAEDTGWRDDLIRSVKDPQVKNFWKRFDNQGRTRQDQKVEPLMSRVWPMTRSKLMNIVGQSSSSFYMDDVVQGNKILLVNLSGVEQGSATLMGTLLMNNLWNSIKTHHSQKGMFLYLDEFHHYMNLPVDIEQMLVEARSMGLGMVLAHQYLGQLTAPNMEAAIMSNAKTKISFQLDGSDARDMATAFGREISIDDLKHLAKYETVARVSTAEGVSAPLTMDTLAPAKPVGMSSQVRWISRGTYGRAVADVEHDILYRHANRESRRTRERPATDGWGF